MALNLHSPRVVLEVKSDESEAERLLHKYAANLKTKGLTKRYGVSLEKTRDTRYRVPVWQIVLTDRDAVKMAEEAKAEKEREEMKTEEQVYRFPVFLDKGDWEYLLTGWDARRRRIRTDKAVSRYQHINGEISGSTADAFPDGDEMKYVVYLTVEDFEYFTDSLRFHPVKGRDSEAAARIRSEITGTYADMTPWEG